MQWTFATQMVNGWKDWDDGWIREVRRRAHFVWVRFAGLDCPRFRVLEKEVIVWEETLKRLCPRRTRCAMAIVTFRRHTPEIFPVIELGAAGRRAWPMTMTHIPARCRLLLELLRLEQPNPIGVFADDFAARWILESGIRPDALILDNPILSRGELEGLNLGPGGTPGFARRSWWPALETEWESWRMHFDRAQLAEGIPSRLWHGQWRLNKVSAEELAAVGRVKASPAEIRAAGEARRNARGSSAH